MDLSKVKWVLIIVVVVGGGWLVTQGGMDYMFEKATKNLPGNDPEQDVLDEATLSKYGGFLLTTFRYKQAKVFYEAAIQRYDTKGKNYYFNNLQLARCEEKLENYREAVTILDNLYGVDADQYDERIPNQDKLKLRIMKLVEMHELLDMRLNVLDRRRGR
jgi:tetratricopeptide (TPR) repeat protein